MEYSPSAELLTPIGGAPEPQLSMDPTHANFCDGVSSVCCGDDMYVYGGHAADRVWRLHLPTATWTEIQTSGQIPLARFFHAACFFRGYMLMCGGELLAGSKLSPSGNGLLYYELGLDTHEWTAIDCFGELPLSRSHHTVTVCRDTMIMFGGKPADGGAMVTNKRLVELKSQGFHDVFILHIISRTWRRVEMYDSRSPMLWGHSATLYSSTHILFFGGFDVSSSELQALDRHGSLVFEDDPPVATISNVTHILNIETMQFQRSTPLPSDTAPAPRAMHVAFSFGDEMIVFGGMTIDPFGRAILTNDCWIWEIVTGRWCRIDFALPQWQSAKLLCCAYYSQVVVANSLSFVFFLDNNRRELSWQRAPCSIQRLLVIDTLANRRGSGGGGHLSNINETFNPRLAVQASKRAETIRGEGGYQSFSTFPGSQAHLGTTWGRSLGETSGTGGGSANAKEIQELRQMINELQAQVRAQEELIAKTQSTPAAPLPRGNHQQSSSSENRKARPQGAANEEELASGAAPPVHSWDFVSPGHSNSIANVNPGPSTRSESQQRSSIVVSKGIKRVVASKDRPPVSGASSAGEWPSPPARKPSPDGDQASSPAPPHQQSAAKSTVGGIRRSKASEHSNSPSDKRSSVSASTSALTSQTLQNGPNGVAVTQAQVTQHTTPPAVQQSSTPSSKPGFSAPTTSIVYAPPTSASARSKEWFSPPTQAALALVGDDVDEEAADLARLADLGLRMHQQLYLSSESKRQLLKKERQDRIAQLQERLLALDSLPLVSEDKKGKINHILEETQSLKTMIETGQDAEALRNAEIHSTDVEAATTRFDPSISDVESAGQRTPPVEAANISVEHDHQQAPLVLVSSSAPAETKFLALPSSRASAVGGGGSSKLESLIQRRKAAGSSRAAAPNFGPSQPVDAAAESLRDHSRHREWVESGLPAGHQALAAASQQAAGISGGTELIVSAPSSSSGMGTPRGAAALAFKFDELNSVLQQQRPGRRGVS